MEVRLASLYSLAINSGLRQRMKSPSIASRSGCRQMQQRRECREKSGGVLEGAAEGMEAKDVGEVGEVEGGVEDAGKIGANVESSLKTAAGAAGGAGTVFSVGA